MLEQQLQNNKKYSDEDILKTHGRVALRANEFYSNLDDWEKDWIKSNKTFDATTTGDEIEIVKNTFAKYKPFFNEYYN